jgi:ribosomal protein S18 acetylase RimI-like enzyme
VDPAAQGHENFCGFVRFTGRLLDDAPALEAPGILAVRGAEDFPAARLALRTEPATPAADFVRALYDFLFDDGKTAAIHTRIDADDDLVAPLQSLGFQEFGQVPEMVCETAPGEREIPSDIRVRLATTADDVRDYADVWLGSDTAIALADLDGRPVAGASMIMCGPDSNRNGYIAWVACRDDARGRGLGDTVTRRVTNEAFARGARVVSLEASQFGEHTYARMGFNELYRYRLLIKL